jgi:sec-independent protein translocase protein TatC
MTSSPKSKLPTSTEKKTAQGAASLWDHVDALRRMLMQVVGVWVVLLVGFFVWMPRLFDSVVLAPCRDDFITYRGLRHFVRLFNSTVLGEATESGFLTESFNIQLINIQLATPFFMHITTSCWFALVAAMPFILWRIWEFVAPALYAKERGGMRRVFWFSSVFFYLGAALGYLLIFPITLHFLSTYELSELVPNQLTLTSYMDNFLMLILLMGLAFQLPLLLLLLNKLGILSHKLLKTHRRHAVVVLVILSAVLTPTGDPFTLMLVALPLYLLYECSIFMTRKGK